jgi:hypothetical protein
MLRATERIKAEDSLRVSGYLAALEKSSRIFLETANRMAISQRNRQWAILYGIAVVLYVIFEVSIYQGLSDQLTTLLYLIVPLIFVFATYKDRRQYELNRNLLEMEESLRDCIGYADQGRMLTTERENMWVEILRVRGICMNYVHTIPESKEEYSGILLQKHYFS